MRDLHFSLDNLPPHLRSQAERQLGLSVPAERAPAPAVFAVPGSTPPPGAAQKPRRRSGGVLKANTRPTPTHAPQAFPAASPSGFASIAEARAQKKAVKRRKTLTPDMAGSLVKSCEVSPDGKEVRIVLNIDSYQLPTAQQKGAFVGNDNRVHFFTKAKIAKAQKTLILALSPLSYHCSQWGKTPISLSIEFCFPFPKTTSKKHLVNYTYHTQKPDLDNIYKDFGDAMTKAGFWDDDSQIAELLLRKFRVLTEPFISITIRRLPNALPGSDLLTTQKTWFFKDIAEREENPNGMS